MTLKEENHELNEMEQKYQYERHHDFMTEKISRKTEKTSSQKEVRRKELKGISPAKSVERVLINLEILKST